MGRAQRPGPRSVELLKWIERLEVVGLEPLGLAHGLAPRTTYSHVERLQAAGLVRRIYDRNGAMVAITRSGRVEVRPELPDPRAATSSLAGGALTNHARATSWTAARATLRGMRWVSDREIRLLPGWQVPVMWRSPGGHRPDLGIVANGARIAVEVELTMKAASRVRAIMAGYQQQLATGQLGGLLYVTGHTAVQTTIERWAQAVGMDRRHLRLLPLADLETETRGLAAASMTTPTPTITGAR